MEKRTAIDEFTEKMNEVSKYWTKRIEVQAQEGKIVVVKSAEGFTFKGGDD